MRGFPRASALLAVLGLACGSARAEEPPPEPPASYAGKDAAWWVEELRGAGTSRAAYEALKVIGTPAVPAIARALTHHDRAFRQQALGLLREIPGDLGAAKEALGAALAGGENPGNEQVLLELIARLGPAGGSLAPLLVQRIDSEQPQVRAAALAALERTGGAPDVVVPAIQRVLKEGDDGQVGMALRVLQRLGPDGRGALPEVLEVLEMQRDMAVPSNAPQRARSPQVRTQAIQAIQRMGVASPEARAALVALARSNVDMIASQAAFALGDMALREPAAADDLADLLAATNASGRRAALQALTSLRPLPPAVQQRMVALLQDGDQEMAGLAASFLSQTDVDPAAVVPALVAALPQRLPAPRLHDALQQIAQREPVAFVRAVPKDLPDVPGVLLDVLAQHARRLARSPVRAEALAMVCAGFLRAKGPASPEARLLEPLIVLGSEGPELLACLRPMVMDDDVERARLAAGVLARVAVLLPAVVEMLDGDARAARGALRVLAQVQSPPTDAEEAALVRLLLGTDRALQREAALLFLEPRATSKRSPADRPTPQREALLAVLLDGLRSAEPRRRAEAMVKLTTVGPIPREALPPLLGLVSDTALEIDCQIAAAVFARAAATDAETARKLLDAELAGTDPLRRAGALLALATLQRDPTLVLDGLRTALASGPPAARVRALRATLVLGGLAGPLEPEVRALVASQDALVAPEAVSTLITIAPRSEEGRRVVLELVVDPRRPWRRQVLPLLRIYGGAAIDTLVRLLGEPEMRAQALSVLMHMGPDAHDALQALEDELRRTPNDRMLRTTVEALRRP